MSVSLADDCSVDISVVVSASAIGWNRRSKGAGAAALRSRSCADDRSEAMMTSNNIIRISSVGTDLHTGLRLIWKTISTRRGDDGSVVNDVNGSTTERFLNLFMANQKFIRERDRVNALSKTNL